MYIVALRGADWFPDLDVDLLGGLGRRLRRRLLFGSRFLGRVLLHRGHPGAVEHRRGRERSKHVRAAGVRLGSRAPVGGGGARECAAGTSSARSTCCLYAVMAMQPRTSATSAGERGVSSARFRKSRAKSAVNIVLSWMMTIDTSAGRRLRLQNESRFITP